MDSLLSFPVGLFHPLQHAGLSRRSPGCRQCGSSLWPKISAQIVRRRASRLDRKVEIVCQSPESCLLAYSVVTGEYHCRSQERVAFSESCLQPIEGSVCFTQPEVGPRNGQCGAVTLFASGLQLPGHSTSFWCVSQQSGNIAKVALAQWQPIVEFLARVRHHPGFVL